MSGSDFIIVNGRLYINEILLKQIVLMDAAGEITSFRVHKYYENAQKRIVLDLMKDNVYLRFYVVQSESGIKVFIYENSKTYRVSGLSFKLKSRIINKTE